MNKLENEPSQPAINGKLMMEEKFGHVFDGVELALESERSDMDLSAGVEVIVMC